MKGKILEKNIEHLAKRLKRCALCPFDCLVNRTNNIYGLCNVGKNSKIFNCTIFFDGIKEIFPSYGIFFAGCNLSCAFCPFYIENKSNKNFAEVDRKIVKKIKDEIRIKKPKSISFLGGEATIHL